MKMKAVAVHFDAAFADINENYMKVEAYIQEAKGNHVKFLAPPEFFTTGFISSQKLIPCIARQEDSSSKMIE